MEPDGTSFEIELLATEAGREIDKALRGGRRTARRYVKALRAVYPNKNPTELVVVIQNLYMGYVSAAGGAIRAGETAVGIALAFLLAKFGGSAGGKAAAKAAGAGIADVAVRKLAELLDNKSRFGITAGFALALADIHGMELDKEQAHALVVLLSNLGVTSQQIALIANELADRTGADQEQGERKNWAITLSELLPGDAAMALVQEAGVERIEEFRKGLSGAKRAAFDAGTAGLVIGVSRYGFGREVVVGAGCAPSAARRLPRPSCCHSELTKQSKARQRGVHRRIGTGVNAVRAFVSAPFKKRWR